MKYMKLYEQHIEGITFKEWLINNPKDINIININCHNSNLIDLEGIQQFKNLKRLICYRNNLTSLPELPNSLEVLYCYSNNLTELPKLSDSLIDLSCQFNNLIHLPELPDSLTYLDCSNNNLTSLPDLPNSLKQLYFFNNNLSSLHNLPDSLIVLHSYNNNLPYNNLKQYKIWHKKNYPWIYKAKNYNL